MVKTNVNPTSHIVQPLMARQFKVKKKNLLKSLYSQPVARINGNLAATLLAQSPAWKLIRGCRHLTSKQGRQVLGNPIRESGLHPLRPLPHKVYV